MTTTKQNDVIFNYIIIESGCSDNPGVHIKEVQMSEGPMYLFVEKLINFLLLIIE